MLDPIGVHDVDEGPFLVGDGLVGGDAVVLCERDEVQSRVAQQLWHLDAPETAIEEEFRQPVTCRDELTTILGCAVDVVSSGGLKDRDDHIRNEAVRL